MSAGPREQTAAILREHSGTFVDQDGDTRCECGKWLEPGEHEWDWHVAGLVVEALNLTEQWTWSWPNGSAPGVPGYGYAVDTREEAIEECDGVPYSIVRRWVSDWSVVGGEPT